MLELESRLIRCFSSVFPGISLEEMRTLNTESTGIWDSLATVTLVAVIQEEFNVDVDPDVLPELESFSAFHAYLQQVLPIGASRGDK